MQERLRVIVSVYACQPGEGSEPGIGWNWVRQLARDHDIWLLTRKNNREPIDRAIRSEGLTNVYPVYVDLPLWASFWKKGQRGIHLYYYLWQIGAYLASRKLHQRIRFSMSHHITLGTYWKPSLLWLLPIPFLWGPVGGGESMPPRFAGSFGMRAQLHEALRNLAQALGRIDPLVRLTARRATWSLVTTQQTEVRVRALGSRKVSVMPQMALPADEIERLSAVPIRRDGKRFRLISLGRLIHWKGFELGVRAFARFSPQFPDAEYWLIGSGSARDRLLRLAHSLGVADRVLFFGALPRPEVLERLASCDVLVHPSLHDSGGWVCLEAMAAGRPVICLDWGGPALAITKESGIGIPARSPEQVISDLAIAFAQLASDPQRRYQMGLAARLRVEQHFSWDSKGRASRELFQKIAASRSGLC